MLHEVLLVPVLFYCCETMIYREKERSTIRDLQMDNLRCFLCITRMDRILKAQIKELCSVVNEEDERTNEIVLQ